MWAAYVGNFSAPAAAYCENFAICMTVGTSATPRSDITPIRSSDSPVPCSMQSMPAAIRPGSSASPKQCAVTRAPCSWAVRDGLGERVVGEGRGEVAGLAGDPVADQLDPPVAPLRLAGDVRRQVRGLDLVGVVADVAPGAGDVAAAPDQAGQVVAVVDPGGVGGHARVADQQGAAVAVLDRLTLGLLVVDRAVVVEPDVAVGVGQTGHDPAARDELGARLGLIGDVTVDDVQLGGLAVGQDRAGEPQRSHGGDATGPDRVVPPVESRAMDSQEVPLTTPTWGIVLTYSLSYMNDRGARHGAGAHPPARPRPAGRHGPEHRHRACGTTRRTRRSWASRSRSVPWERPATRSSPTPRSTGGPTSGAPGSGPSPTRTRRRASRRSAGPRSGRCRSRPRRCCSPPSSTTRDATGASRCRPTRVCTATGTPSSSRRSSSRRWRRTSS